MIQSKEEGGLNMVDFVLCDKALKLCWVKRFCSEGNQPWKFIPLYWLNNLGGTLLFKCNYVVKYLNLSSQLKKDVLDQILRNNRFIKINKASLSHRNWHQAGICKLSCLVDGNKQHFLSFSDFSRKFHFKCNFLQYYGLLSAMSSDWKSYLKLELKAATANMPAVNKLTCKTIYNTLIKHRNSSGSSIGREKTKRMSL